MNLTYVVDIRIHTFNLGTTKLVATAKEIYYPYVYRSVTSVEENCT